MRENYFYGDLSRKEKQAAIQAAGKALRTGEWEPWDRISFPDGLPSKYPGSWLQDVKTVCRNGLYAVLIREFDVAGMTVWHCAITCGLAHEPSWKEKMRIKCELFDPEATAVEICPPVSELVDEADMYHLWVMNASLPFSLHKASAARPEGEPK